MAKRELRRFRRELSDAAIVYSVAGAGLAALQAGQERALADTEGAVRESMAAARSAGAGAEVDRLLQEANAHPDFIGDDKTQWLAFLQRLSAGDGAPPSPTDPAPGPTPVAEPVADEPPPIEPASPVPSAPQQAWSRDRRSSVNTERASSNQGLAKYAWIPVLILGMLAGPWIVNKVVTRTSAEVGQCYDNLKAVTGDFDRIDCDRFDAQRLFAVGSTDELQASSGCPNHALTVIVERPDQSYCFAPSFLGPAQASARTSPETAAQTIRTTTTRPTTITSTTSTTSTTEDQTTVDSEDEETNADDDTSAGPDPVVLRPPTDFTCTFVDIAYGGEPARLVQWTAQWTWTDRSDGESAYLIWGRAGPFELPADAETVKLVSGESNENIMTSMQVVGPDGSVLDVATPSCQQAGGVVPPFEPPNSTTPTTTPTTTAGPGPQAIALSLIEAANAGDAAAARQLAPAVVPGDIDLLVLSGPLEFGGCSDGPTPECHAFGPDVYVNIGFEGGPADLSVSHIGFHVG